MQLRALILSSLVLPSVASAVPLTLTHQGRLLDSTGTPLTGSHTVTTSLFDAPSAGESLWSDTFTLEFDDGYYSVLLGSSELLEAEAFDDDAVYLELAVDGNPPLDRTPISSVPFAVRADTARYADVTMELQGGPVDASEIRVNGTTIISSDGKVSLAAFPDEHSSLDSVGCTGEGEVAAWDGVEWSCMPNLPVHEHSADELTSGTIVVDRLPIGTSDDTVARGSHGHSWTDLEGDLPATLLPTDLSGDTTIGGSPVSTGNHFSESDAVAALGNKADDNPLNHDRYTDSEAVASLGNKADDNPLNHDRYTDSEAVASLGNKADDNPLNHDRYTDSDAVASLGNKADDNPLNHDRYTDSEAVAAVGRKVLVADYMRSTSEIYGGTNWGYTSLDNKAGPFTITTDGGPVHITFKAMTYLHARASQRDSAGLIIHPVIDGSRHDYCDYIYVRGWGTDDDFHGPIVCDMILELSPGEHTIGFEHRHLGYRTILYGGRYRSSILIEQL